MLLYIHVPFCRRRCYYCAFYSGVLPEDGVARLLNAYQKTLLAEVDLWGKRLGAQPVESVFFGGGTPSMLPVPLLGKILNALSKRFQIQPGAEISLEGNPDSLLQYGYMDALLKLGVNRLSIGVQSLNDEFLRFLGRPHTAKEAEHAFMGAKTAGFKNVNLDLMFGIPGQRSRQWLEDLKIVSRWKPEHLSCYGLTLEEGTPLEKAVGEGRYALPPEKEQAAMYAYGTEFLEANGFMHYEISNFARMGFKCRHNLGYWEGEEYLGLGPSAVSTIRDRRWSNPESLGGWIESVSRKSCGQEAEVLTRRDKVLELIMLRLRTERGLKLQTYRELSGRDFLKDHKGIVEALLQKGLAKLRGGHFSLSNDGMLVSDAILGHLFAAAEEKMGVTGERQRPDADVKKTTEQMGKKKF